MKSFNDIKEDISEIISVLEKGPDTKGNSAIIIVSYCIWIPVVAIVIYKEVLPWPDFLFAEIVVGILIVLAPIFPAMWWEDWKGKKLVESQKKEYYNYFPTSKEQVIANSSLLKIVAHGTEKPLVDEFRRSVGAITNRFYCSECGKRVKDKLFIEQKYICSHCNSNLRVEIPKNCPRCDSKSVTIVSPDEQVEQLGEDETTAGLGFFGQILDLIYYPFRLLFRASRVISKSYSFQCKQCKYTWAIKLPTVEK